MKIFVTGNAGAGKSTLGKKIAAELGTPFYTLDKVAWQERWKKTPAEEKKRSINQIMSKTAWVIDGVSDDVLRGADIVIFLDVPRLTCLKRGLMRSSKYLFSSRPDMPPHCPEILILPTLIKIIWRFPRRGKLRILAEGKVRGAETFIHVASRTDLEDFMSKQLPRLRNLL